MRVLVTGSSGGVGRYVVEELKGRHDVVGYDLTPPTNTQAGPARFVRGDIRDLGTLAWAMQDVQGIIHLAAIPNPFNDPPARIIDVNVRGTYCVLETARLAGVRKMVMASSDSALGFTFRHRDFLPEYLPIDERHALMPQEAYCLSKALGEQICWAYSRGTDVETIALRICHILMPTRLQEYRNLISNSDNFARGLWVYTHAEDSARAFRLALEAEGVSGETFFIAAKDLLSEEKTLDLIVRYYPEVERVDRERLQGYSSLIDCQKAETMLAYKSLLSWRDCVG